MEQSARSKDSVRVQSVVNATLLHFENLGTQDDVNVTKENDTSMAVAVSSLMQSQPTGDQASAHGVMPIDSLQGFHPGEIQSDWAENEGIVVPMDDTSWTYLEQFLNLSDDGLMLDT